MDVRRVCWVSCLETHRRHGGRRRAVPVLDEHDGVDGAGTLFGQWLEPRPPVGRSRGGVDDVCWGERERGRGLAVARRPAASRRPVFTTSTVLSQTARAWHTKSS